MEKQALVQLRRKKVLRGACRRHPLLHQDPRSAGQMFILEKRKILYCSVPKTGSTNWKRIFMVLEGVRPNLQNISSYEAHYSNGFKVLPHSGLLRQIRELDSYTKFLQVRHPFARLISAYRNKISGEIPWNWQEERFQQIALYIARKYRKGAHAGWFNLTTLRVSWDEWVRYLTDPAERSGFNSHWREMYKLCLPCRVQYDLIGKLESVDSDLSFLLDHLGLEHILFPSIRPLYHREDEKTGNALIRQYFGNMSQRDLQRLYKIYQLDFEIFGFEKPGLLNF
ncbi:carbohydrate sulfotransferase 8-like [Acanthaster planci]|uniref:Carbohydrate sulfotransferase n=1 Tax=Acanthaster planci TaxID=133434 RepID=A0A8B7ZUM7_ACAPL|nr:carbohydrate sulfotransferase 8-like [Acanthaster planci]